MEHNGGCPGCGGPLTLTRDSKHLECARGKWYVYGVRETVLELTNAGLLAVQGKVEC